MSAEVVEDQTEPLSNGEKLPDHPANTTALKIVSYGKVRDANDGTFLRGGLHQNEVRMLMARSRMALSHLYAYAILNGCIYHTRDTVVIEVKCVPYEPVV